MLEQEISKFNVILTHDPDNTTMALIIWKTCNINNYKYA